MRRRRLWPRLVRPAAALTICAAIGHWWLRSLDGITCIRCGRLVHHWKG